MNIQERIEALETEFAEKIKALKTEAQQEREFPQYGEDYWLIRDGCVTYTMFTDNYVDQDRKEIGNIFKTREQAEFTLEKLKVEAELRKFSKTPDVNGVNWLIVCADSEEVYTLYTTQEIYQGTIYFESKKVAQQAIESVGKDRIKKYLFGVED